MRALLECQYEFKDIPCYAMLLDFNYVPWIVYLWGATVLPLVMEDRSVGLAMTGERVIPEERHLWWHLTYLTHQMEYEAAGRRITRDMIVMDCACGVGYGSKYLSSLSREVIGVDNSEEAVEYARKNYVADNLSYHVGDAQKLDRGSNTVDAFVAIETLEHFSEADGFLDEVYRVLKPGGLLFLSTPDGDTGPHKRADYKAGNFHYCHYTKSELESMFRDKYTDVRIARDGMNGECYRVIAYKRANGEGR
jgi:SAM-dependent methyltransferase